MSSTAPPTGLRAPKHRHPRGSPAPQSLPGWWHPDLPRRSVLLALAATPGRLPVAVAARLAEGLEPSELATAATPSPSSVAEALEAIGASFLTADDAGWPFAEREPDPPCAWLFVDGPEPPPASQCIGIVGGRRASPLRRAAARSLAAGLSAGGLTVVSGGAVGVDAAAHVGALEGGGGTVAVLGCGLDVAYPRANAALFARLRREGGTFVTEHAPGARPHASHFIPRNRLIAAMSQAVIVVEAGEASGSLATARAAGSRGPGHVLVVPGAPWDPGAAGANALIRDGATLVRGLDDVLEAIGGGWAAAQATDSGGSSRSGPRQPMNLGGAARAVLEALIDGMLTPWSELARRVGLDSRALADALFELELAGLVERTMSGVQVAAAGPRGPC